MQKLASELAVNLEYFNKLFHSPDNSDFVVREFSPYGVRMAVLYIDGMAQRANIEDMMLRPLMSMRPFGGTAPEDRASALLEMVLPTGTGDLTDDTKVLANFILDGNCALICDGSAQAVLAEMQGYATRSIPEPQMESVTYGSHEAFNESIRTNLTLLHRMLRSPDFVTEMMEIGETTKTKVAMVYLSGTANPKLIAEVRRRMNGVEVDKLLSIGQLQQLIEDRPSKLLPQIIQTERPDRTVSFLMDGLVAIVCDNAPYSLSMPATFLTFIHTADDHTLRWQYSSFNRLVRILGCLISLMLPAIYNALLVFHQELLPTDLLTSILEGYALVPLSVTLELVIMDFVFDLINEAGIRMQGNMGNTLGIVGGLVLGQAAVSANLVSPTLIIIVSIAGLGLFAVPNYSLSVAVRIARLGLIFASSIAGFAGIALVMFYLLCSGSVMESFGTPYFAPVAPYMRHNPDTLFRLPNMFQTRKPDIARPLKTDAGKSPRAWDKGGK